MNNQPDNFQINKPFDFEERLVEFASDCAIFAVGLFGSATGDYYGNQLLRTSGASALNYGESQGTNTDKDFVSKAFIVRKELKESRINLKILLRLFKEKSQSIIILKDECEELTAIVSSMIYNRKSNIK